MGNQAAKVVKSETATDTELLRRWKATFAADGAEAFPGHGNLPPAEDELRRLKAEVARLKAERDILKKATALFARESL